MTDSARKAPWQDYKGDDLYAGDTISHPCGTKGVIILNDSFDLDSDKWLVKYGRDDFSRLIIQIGDKGQAVKVGVESNGSN